MVIEELLNLLNKDFTLRPYAAEVSEKDNVIVYAFDTVTSDGVVGQYRLSLTIISEDLKTCYENLEKIKNVLLTIGDAQLSDDILTVTLNGGGSMYNYDTDTYHLKANFIVVTKERKNR